MPAYSNNLTGMLFYYRGLIWLLTFFCDKQGGVKITRGELNKENGSMFKQIK